MLEMTDYYVHENVSGGVVTVYAKLDSAKNGCPVNESFKVRFRTKDVTAGIYMYCCDGDLLVRDSVC